MKTTRALSPKEVLLSAGFWKSWQDLVADRVLPYQWKALNDEVPGAEPSHSIENFRIAAGLKQGQFYGLIFQDSDIGKWIEAAAYSLMYRPDPSLEAKIDGAVEVIAAAQEPDGYLQTYFSVKAKGQRWTDFAMGHEMYCGGHLIEGAVAYYRATGKTAFLEVVKRYADHLCVTFGPGPGQMVAYDGHPEIELALHKLADATGTEKYRDLARFFVDERGKHPGVLDPRKIIAWPHEANPWNGPDYYQDHKPVREQTTAEGHSVRAMYLYTAMADQRLHDGDASLQPALDALWNNVVDHRMYVTGGLGGHAWGERFSIDDDAPSSTAYTETCAAIGLVMWAWRMTLIHPEGRFADVLERALYNGALSGISADGERYFYVNPLEVTPKVARYRRDHDHVKTQRVAWFGCSCCPPNIARTIASVSQYQYTFDDSGVWLHQFASGKARIPLRGTGLEVDQATEYPWDGRVSLRLSTVPGGAFDLRLRIPGWCSGASVTVNGSPVPLRLEQGYAVLTRSWQPGDRIDLDLPMEVRVVRSHPRIRDTFGQGAVHRGPLVWCAEEKDNGADLHGLSLGTVPPGTELEQAPDLGPRGRRLVVPGFRAVCPPAETAFLETAPDLRPTPVVLVPYALWGNRGEGEMRVWLRLD